MNRGVEFSGATARWIRIAILNLMVVALAGVFTRYKLSYSLPQIDFKNLINAHSHFAFTAWVSTSLFALLAAFFLNHEGQTSKIYSRLFLFNQISAYGMLVSFLLEDYGTISIIFSSLSVLVSYAYAYFLWKDTNHERKLIAVKALRFSLICLVVSSFGPYGMMIMKAFHYFNLIYFNNAIYWYLHFQYNGWFSFAVFAIAIRCFEHTFNEKQHLHFNTFLGLMIYAIVPVYLVSVLWTIPSGWVFALAGIGAFLQLIAVVLIWNEAVEKKNEMKNIFKGPGGWLLLISFLSVSTKLVLQFFCIFPELNKFVFGHRPVIIGYLHLVLIGFVSFFIVGICIRNSMLSFRKKIAGIGITLFVIGFIITEFTLLLHGIDTITMNPIPGLSQILFAAAVLMLFGIILFALPQEKFVEKSEKVE